MTATAPQYGDLDDHHVVPKGWGKERALDTTIDSHLHRIGGSSQKHKGKPK